jgi:hypothetical protein
MDNVRLVLSHPTVKAVCSRDWLFTLTLAAGKLCGDPISIDVEAAMRVVLLWFTLLCGCGNDHFVPLCQQARSQTGNVGLGAADAVGIEPT